MKHVRTRQCHSFLTPFLIFYEAWEPWISEAAKKHCIPECLLWEVILAELIDFDVFDYFEKGHSLGPGQLSPSSIDFYDLGNRDRKNVPTNIDMTAEKIDKQLIELCTAASGGGGDSSCPGLTNVPPLKEDFLEGQFPTSVGEGRKFVRIFCQMDASKCSRERRCNDPMSTFNLITCNSDSPIIGIYKNAVFAASLASMNDILPGSDVPGTKDIDESERWYNRRLKTSGAVDYRAHAWAMYNIITSGKIGCDQKGKLTWK